MKNIGQSILTTKLETPIDNVSTLHATCIAVEFITGKAKELAQFLQLLLTSSIATKTDWSQKKSIVFTELIKFNKREGI